jgi:hypothetical protein
MRRVSYLISFMVDPRIFNLMNWRYFEFRIHKTLYVSPTFLRILHSRVTGTGDDCLVDRALSTMQCCE